LIQSGAVNREWFFIVDYRDHGQSPPFFFLFLVDLPKQSDNRQSGPNRQTIKKTQVASISLPIMGEPKNTNPAQRIAIMGVSENPVSLEIVFFIRQPSHLFFCVSPSDQALR
jgi:hypothetical protein